MAGMTGTRTPQRHWATAVAAALVLALSACTGGSAEPEAAPRLEGCGPVGYDAVRGRAPSYVEGPLAAHPNDAALCRGLWLPRTSRRFVPQGLVVRGRTAWVSGYDKGVTRGDDDTCRIVALDLRTGAEVAQRSRIRAELAPRGPASCRHAGGLSLDEHGLWVSQFTKVWLLDPRSLDVRRVWHLVGPVRGSFLVHDEEGRLGVGGFHRTGRWPLHWFSPATLFEPGRLDLLPDDAVAVQRGPSAAQGAVHADLGPGPARVWFTRSNTYCGEIWAGPRRRLAFLPGAEGVDLAGDGTLWVVSETTAAPYFRQGGRPAVPTLAQYDVDGLRRWQRSTCDI